MKDGHYDDLNHYLESEFSKRSTVVRNGQNISVNFSANGLARDAYEFGKSRNYDLPSVREKILGFLEQRFGDKQAKRAISHLEDN